MNKRVLLCGYFAFGTDDYGGQPVKGRALYNGLRAKYGAENVHFIETANWKKHPFRLLMRFFWQAKKYDKIIMLPAHNGLIVFSRLLKLVKHFYHKDIYYAVVGGWLPDKVKESRSLLKTLQAFNGIWVETTSMKKNLDKLGFHNVVVVPNFKDIIPLKENEVIEKFEKPYPVLTFARIMEEKGTEDAINAVREINDIAGEIVITLDLYGQIYEPYRDRFEKLQGEFPEYINYRGIVNSEKSVDTLKNYYALLFPTHFYTEGVPGTLIDALCAGVPVITSLWGNSSDIFKQDVTGWGYEFGKSNMLKEFLLKAIQEPERFLLMRKKSLKEAKKFSPQSIIEQIDDLLYSKEGA